MNYCPQCGMKVTGEMQFCPRCGSYLNHDNQEAQQTNHNNQYSGPANYYSHEQPKQKVSALSIIAFILSFTVFLSIVGVILAIIDVACHKDKKHGFSVAAIVIGGIILFGQGVNILSSSSENYNTADINKQTLSERERREAYIESCVEVPYKEVERYPDDYKGQKIKIEGTVLQVTESLGSVILRVATAKNGYDDIWYVTYKKSSGEQRILEDDHIVLYGECTGVETYIALLGNQITIPAMTAKYVIFK